MDADSLRPKLMKRIALLPGSRDREGGPLIIFPSQGEWKDYPYSEVSQLLSYLSQIPEDRVRASGFTILVDMRNGWIKYLKTILRACQHVLHGCIRQVLIIKPEQFLEKQKINLDLMIEAYDFKALAISFPKLSRHVDSTQLPNFLGGTYPYDHENWIDTRHRYETFLRECSGILRKLRSESSIDEGAGQMSNGSVPSTSHRSDEPPVNKERINEMTKSGDKLLIALRGEKKEDGDSTPEKAPNPDFLVAAQRVEILLRQIKERKNRVESTVVEQEKVQKTQKAETDANIYAQFLEGVNNVSDWLLGPGEKWLFTLHEIGESKDEAEQLRKEHDHLDAKSQEVIRQAIELKAVADKLIDTKHPNSSDIRKKKEYLDSVSRAFCGRVRWQKEMIKFSCRFHRVLEDLSIKLDEMLESLCSEVLANDAKSAEAAVKSMDTKLEAIDKSYSDLISSGQSFIDQLNIREHNTLGNEVVRDYSAGAVHVRQCLDDLHDRKQRCSELADVRRLKLQQLQQLFTCEKDCEQAINWIEELHQNLLNQQSKLGSTAEEVTVMKHEQIKMEQTSRSTYEYGKQLVQVSLVLRRSLRIDLTKQQQLAVKLDDTWAKFCRTLSERTASLNIGTAFYNTVREVNDRLEELCQKVSQENKSLVATPHSTLERPRYSSDSPSPLPRSPPSPRSRSSTPAGGRGIAQLDRYDSLRRQLGHEVRELRHMAEALISRMEVPQMLAAKDDKYEDSRSAKEIRNRITQIEAKQSTLDSLFTEPTNFLVRDLRLSDVHVSLRPKYSPTLNSSYDNNPYM